METTYPRVERVAREVQGVLGTVFEFNLVEGGGTLTEADIFELDRPKRWRKTDPLSFRVHFNAGAVSTRSDAQLVNDLLHEIIHALTHDIYEKAHHRRHQAASDGIYEAWEAATYQTERAFSPLVQFWFLPRWKRVLQALHSSPR